MSRSGRHMDFVVMRRNAFVSRARRLGIVVSSGLLQCGIVDVRPARRQSRVAAEPRARYAASRCRARSSRLTGAFHRLDLADAEVGVLAERPFRSRRPRRASANCGRASSGERRRSWSSAGGIRCPGWSRGMATRAPATRIPGRPTSRAVDADARARPERVQAFAGRDFNSVLLNLYRDGRDGMGWHADDEPELGPNPVIASVSLGAVRRFCLRHRRRRGTRLDLALAHGSLLLMSGATQQHWVHSVPKTVAPVGERINLTFRRWCLRRTADCSADGSGHSVAFVVPSACGGSHASHRAPDAVPGHAALAVAPGCARRQQAVSYKNDVAPILAANCASCHVPGQPGYVAERLRPRGL